LPRPLILRRSNLKVKAFHVKLPGSFASKKCLNNRLRSIFLSILSKWGINLKKIGEVLHLGPSNRAIAKIDNLPKIGTTVFDVKKKPIGVVIDIFGPVKSPYIEIEVKNKSPKKIIGSPIYIMPKTKKLGGRDENE